MHEGRQAHRDRHVRCLALVLDRGFMRCLHHLAHALRRAHVELDAVGKLTGQTRGLQGQRRIIDRDGMRRPRAGHIGRPAATAPSPRRSRRSSVV